jgi:ATP-binding cassette, subfamily C (CFTR/MRP), member 1
MLLTLLRMTEVTRGSTEIDGIDISMCSRQDLRLRITSIPQEMFALPGSVRFDMDPNHEAQDSAIREALDRAGLWDIVEDCGGLGVQMENIRLSHGQQQLFSLARALLRRSKLVLLDEATSAVDKETEAKILEIIQEDFKHATVLAVAHRLNTISNYDRVAVLDRGQLVEFDEPTKLLQRDSLFRELYKKQV